MAEATRVSPFEFNVQYTQNRKESVRVSTKGLLTTKGIADLTWPKPLESEFTLKFSARETDAVLTWPKPLRHVLEPKEYTHH